MDKNKQKIKRRVRRKAGIRKRIIGTPQRPRLTVYRSSKHIYAQVIDDLAGKTLLAASTIQIKQASSGNVDAATAIGTAVAEQAKSSGIEQVAFDRNGYKYHGRVKALAEAARAAGLRF